MNRYFYFEQKIFQWALLLSLTVHVLLFIQLSRAKALEKLKPLKSVEITYREVLTKFEQKKTPKTQEKVVPKDSPPKVPDLPDFKTGHADSGNGAALLKDAARLSHEPDLVENKGQPVRISPVIIEKKINLSDIKPSIASSPSYVGYDSVIRDQIKARLDQNVDSARKNAGDVYISFVVNDKGELLKVSIVADRTNADSYLQEICWRSVRESSPFKPFPKDLNYPQLPFGVLISFGGQDDGFKAQ